MQCFHLDTPTVDVKPQFDENTLIFSTVASLFYDPKAEEKDGGRTGHRGGMDHMASWGKEFIAGGMGGMAGVIAGHPLDTIRIHQQQPQLPSAGGPRAGAIVRRLLATEGPVALFKGMSSPLATIAVQNAVSFQAYALLSRALAAEGNDPLPLQRVAVAGIGAGALQTIILTPVDLVKIRLQLQTVRTSAVFCGVSKPKFGPLEVARNIIQREGLRGLYRGFSVTVLRDAPSHAVYFGSYEYIREYLHPGCRKNGDESLMTMLTAGGFAGSISWIACYPLDVVKSRLQAQGPDSKRYKGIIDCVSKSVREEGIRVLFRGFGTAIARAYLVNGAIFSVYEMTLRLLYAQPRQDNMLENPM